MLTPDKLLDAIGRIGDEKIEEVWKLPKKPRTLHAGKAIAFAAALCLLATPAAAVAAGNETAYQAVYALSPVAAQALKPVRMSCADNGIRMEVESAKVRGGEAEVILSMTDLVGDRIDQTFDLYDSYSIGSPYSSAASCNLLDYDPESGKVTCGVRIRLLDESKSFDRSKITFSVREFLSGKRTTEGEVDFDLSLVAEAAETQLRHYTGIGIGDVRYTHDGFDEEVRREPCLVPDHSGLFVADGVELTGAGYIDGRLHLQVGIPNRLDNDNHGSFSLKNSRGEEVGCAYQKSWREKADGTEITYEEYIFDLPMEEIGRYRLHSRFITSDGAVRGNWQVTFSLEE